MKTIVIFGAGTGLGSAVARRFGRDGHRVALVARDRARLDALVTDLAAEGVEAAAFVADLSRPEDVPGLIERIRDRFGRIDVVEYAPITTEGFTPATGLDAASERRHLDVLLLSLIEVVRAVLPEMQARGSGGILLGQGSSAVHPRPGLSGVGPAMAAARNYMLTLNGELAGTGVYAGVLHVGAMILGSAGHRAMVGGEMATRLDPATLPTVEPADLADRLWTMLAERGPAEDLVPAA